MSRLRVYATEAIALKRMDFGEADRLITVVTPQLGKLRLLAKGVRRPTSRMSGHLELFAHAHLMVARGRNLDIATQASTIEPFREVREDLIRASFAYYLGELIDLFLQDADAHPAVFALFRDALSALALAVVPADLVLRHFELHLLGSTGFGPQLTSCLICRSDIQPEENLYSATMGGIVCPRCRHQAVAASPIDIDSLKTLRYLQRTPSTHSLRVRPPEAIGRTVEGVLRRQVESVLERRLRAPDFVRRVAEETAGYRA